MDNLVGILHQFGIALSLEINWHKSVVYWCGCGIQPGWVDKYQWKWVAHGDMSKLLGTPFGLHLELHNVDQFLINRVKVKLKYWSSTHLSLASRTLIVHQVLMSSFWCFIAVWAGLKKILGKIKVMLRNYLWSGSKSMVRA